jgi:hypothetical protein
MTCDFALDPARWRARMSWFAAFAGHIASAKSATDQLRVDISRPRYTYMRALF